MTTALQFYHELLEAQLPSWQQEDPLEDEQYLEITSRIEQEEPVIQRQLTREITSQPSLGERNRRVADYLTELSMLINQLGEYIDPEMPDDNWSAHYYPRDVLTAIGDSLLGMYSFFELNYHDAIDPQTRMPHLVVTTLLQHIEDAIPVATRLPSELRNRDDSVWCILLRAVSDLKNGNHASFSCLRLLHQVGAAAAQLQQMKESAAVMETELGRLLCELNFNYEPFYQYLIKGYTAQLEALPDLHSRRRLLNRLTVEWKVRQPEEKIGWFAGRLTLKDTMLLWLEGEERCLEQMREPVAVPEQVLIQEEDEVAVQENVENKILLLEGVAVIAALLRVMVACGMISSASVAGLTRLFAGNFATKSKSAVSVKYFGNLYYQPSRNTLDRLYTLCLTMSKKCRELQQ